MKRVNLITTGQPSTNPRLCKEVEALISAQYEVIVIYCFYQSWAAETDQAILKQYPHIFYCCGGDKTGHSFTYFFTRLRFKLFNFLIKFTFRFNFAAHAISRTHADSLRLAKQFPADLVIAHNLGALPAAVQAAKFLGAKVGYDAEDMHSGQFITKNLQFKLNRFIEQKYFPKVDFFTAASPLIAQTYQQLFPFLNPVVINNVFNKNTQAFKAKPIGSELQIFWFSQTVGAGRGLEQVIAALHLVKHPCVLHLVGLIDSQTKSAFEQLLVGDKDRLCFYAPLPPESLFSFAMQFDVGLASEIKTPLNRDICLTNKIFTYLQTGLAIIASDTQAQMKFLKAYPKSGRLYTSADASSFAAALNHLINHPDELAAIQAHNFQLGQETLNWGIESKKWLAVINQTLQHG